MGNRKNSNEKNSIDGSYEKLNAKNTIGTVAAFAGIILGFLVGSFVFYQVGKDSLSNSFEGQKILFQQEIDSLKQEKCLLLERISQLTYNLENCIEKNDSILNENHRLRKIITESKYKNNIIIASLIKSGKALLSNGKPIQEWLNECIAFLEKNYKNEVTSFKNETNYTLSDVGQRSIAIENGIKILKKLN